MEGTLFRHTKKRKFTRNRQGSGSTESRSPRREAASPENESEPTDAPVSDILRLRKNWTRKSGIAFSNARTRSSEPPPPPSTDLATVDPDAEKLKAITDRFVAHSGQTMDVDKHMIDYIESEMAKRRHGAELSESSDDGSTAGDPDDDEELDSPNRRPVQRQPAGIGKIHEIDLGKDTSLRNEERTELAVRRARGEQVPPEEPSVVKKPKLGRNGKPRRGPKQRNSEDVERDQLVEQVLHESRLDIYDEPEPEPQDETLGTDDRIAEQFRRDFMEAMYARRRHRTSGQPKPPASRRVERPPRGPKLGGSRSARAAMREQREREKEAKEMMSCIGQIWNYLPGVNPPYLASGILGFLVVL